MPDPIKLLDFYTEKDHEILYGRDHETKSLIQLLGNYSIVIISGESGTGKTSLIRAGLIPSFTTRAEVIYHRMNSDSQKQLSRIFLSYLSPSKDNISSFLSLCENFFDRVQRESKEYIIILDQFEELLVENRDRKEWFPVSILSLIGTTGPIRFLFSLRSDYLPLFMNWLHPTRLHFFAEQFYYLTRFSLDKAREVLHHMISYHNISPDFEIVSALTTQLAGLDREGTVYPPHLQIIASFIVEQSTADKFSFQDLRSVKNKEMENILSGFFNKELFKGMTNHHQGIIKQVLDTLVGREGLRRKLTLGELADKVRLSESDLEPLLKQLIQRRTLRRNEENKYELIHDFLSRHFFESFSTEEKHNRRLQDMFAAAKMDYHDAGIFLDERRIRLFLHFREILDLDKEARIFLIKSVLSLFIIGYNPYLDLSMSQDLLELLRIESNRENKLSMIGKLQTLIGYNDLPLLYELYQKEPDYSVKAEYLTLLTDLDPGWVKKTCNDHLKDWRHLHEIFLEGLLRAVRLCLEPYFSHLILPIFSEHASESIQLTAIETMETLKDSTIIPDLLTILEEKKITIPRVIDSCVLAIDNLFNYVRDRDEYESLKRRFIILLKKIIYRSVYVSQPNVFSAYIKYSVPDPSECESLITTTQDNYNIESIIHAMGEIGDSGYKDPLLFFINNTNDTSYIEAAISSLGRLKSKSDSDLYKKLYKKYSSAILKSIILDNLINVDDFDENDSDLPDLFHSIIENRDEEDMNLLMIAISGLSKIGNETDIRLLGNIFVGSHDVNLKEHIISTISSFNPIYSASIRNALKHIWDRETEDSIRIIAGCKLFLAGEHALFPLLLERLSVIDEHFELFIQQSLFVINKDSVLEIFRTLLRYSASYPEAEATKRTLQHIVLHSANREFASIALAILGSRFGDTAEMQNWFYELVSIANRPELRGLAILSLTEIPHGNILDFLEERIFSSNWPTIQKFALYALGLQDLEETDHTFRIKLLDRFIRESKSYDLFDHALWVYYACGRKTDYDNLHQLIYDEHSMSIRNNYYIQQIENIIDHIQERSLRERALPDLADLYKIDNYGWRQSLRLNPMIFSF